MKTETKTTTKKTAAKKPMAKPRPFIDYKTANLFARMYDFITDTNRMREKMNSEIDRAIAMLQLMKKAISPVSDPNDQFAYFDYNHFTHDIAALRADAWEAGLTKTLFEKLSDKDFRNRFTGWAYPPVQEDEIKDHHFDDDGKLLKKPESKKMATA